MTSLFTPAARDAQQPPLIVTLVQGAKRIIGITHDEREHREALVRHFSHPVSVKVSHSSLSYN